MWHLYSSLVYLIDFYIDFCRVYKKIQFGKSTLYGRISFQGCIVEVHFDKFANGLEKTYTIILEGIAEQISSTSILLKYHT